MVELYLFMPVNSGVQNQPSHMSYNLYMKFNWQLEVNFMYSTGLDLYNAHIYKDVIFPNILYKHTAVETWVSPSSGPNLANPKSDNLAFHCSSRRMLEDLKSLKMIYRNNGEIHHRSFPMIMTY